MAFSGMSRAGGSIRAAVVHMPIPVLATITVQAGDGQPSSSRVSGESKVGTVSDGGRKARRVESVRILLQKSAVTLQGPTRMNCYSILTPTRLKRILTRVAHRITILQSQLVILTTSTDTINVERILKLPVPLERHHKRFRKGLRDCTRGSPRFE